MATPLVAMPSTIVVIDTSAWVSSLVRTDGNYISARRWMNQHISSGGLFVAPVLLVVESAATFSRSAGNPGSGYAAIAQLRSFPFMRLIPIDQAIIDDAADIAAQFGIRGSDSIFVAVAKQLAIPLVTFDHEQLTRPITIISTIKP